MKHSLTYLLLLCLLLTYATAAQPAYLQPNLAYTTDIGGNLTGGSKQAFTYMGLVDAALLLDTEKAQWWKGGLLNLGLISTHSKGISTTSLHDQQGISNIEAGNHPLIFWEVWHHQQFRNLEIRLGLQNINSDFMNQPFTGNFSGSSYAIFPTLSLNYSLPNYPVAGLGLTFTYTITNHWKIRHALFNGQVNNLQKYHQPPLASQPEKRRTTRPHRNKIHFPRYTSPYRHLRNRYRFSRQTLPGCNQPNPATYPQLHPLYIRRTRPGQNRQKKAGLFLQASYAPKNRNTAWLYTAAGIITHGFLTHKQTEQAGIGISQLHYQAPGTTTPIKTHLESTLETYIQYSLTHQLTIKPTFFTLFTTRKKTAFATLVRISFRLNP